MSRPAMRPEPVDFLARMAGSSAGRAHAAQRRLPESILARHIRHQRAVPPLRLSVHGFDVIAEVKRRSPSAGVLARDGLSLTAQARHYVRGGAMALSVLTEPDAFAGDMRHLAQVAGIDGLAVPAMRKDFLVSPYQLLEARAGGAGGVLLIAALLDDYRLREMLRCARTLGLFALVEVFDHGELARAAAVLRRVRRELPARGDGLLLGVNCRDLRSLQVDFGRFAALAPALPADIPVIAESGIGTPAEAAHVAELGYCGALVGTALMRAAEPALQVASILAAGRASARRRG